MRLTGNSNNNVYRIVVRQVCKEVKKLAKKKKDGNGGMTQMDMLLGLICAIFFLDTIPSVATLGWASITWNIVVGILFFLCGSMVCAELGAAFPDDGGFAGWAARGLSPKWGARVGYMYWAGNAVWLSTNANLFVQIFQITFNIELSKPMGIIMNLVVVYVMLGLLLLPNKSTLAMYNFGGIAKIFVGVVLVLAGFAVFTKNGAQANPFSASELKPTFGASIIFIPALVYNFLGFETSAANGKMENPARDVPKAAIKNVLLIIVLYVVTVTAMLWVVPISDISITTGVMQTIQGGLGRNIFTTVVGILYLAIIFVQGMLWIGAPCNTAAIAGDTGELPKIFSKRNSNDRPQGAIIISGVMATIMTLASSALTGEAESVFWAMFSCTSIMLVVLYLINFEAYFAIKKKDTITERPYVFPGPSWFSNLWIRIAEFIVIATMVLYVWTPGVPLNVQSFLFVVIGFLVVFFIGEILIKLADKEKSKNN